MDPRISSRREGGNVEPYVFVNALLTGFFASAGLYFYLHWRYSLHDHVPIAFAVHCVAVAFYCPWVVLLATASTIPQAQFALDMHAAVGLVAQLTVAWVLWLVTGVRAGWYVLLLACIFLPVSLLHFAGVSLNGEVTALRDLTLPWGERVVLPEHRPPRLWSAALMAIIITVDVLGFIGAARLWRTDKLGALFIGAGTAGMAVAHLVGVLVEIFQISMPLLGALPLAFFVAFISLHLSRDYAQRGEALQRSEERYRLIVKNQTEFIVRWRPDCTRTFVNESYCKYFGVRQEDCLGTSFLPLIVPEHREAILRKIASITPANPEATDQHASFTSDGQRRWQEWTDVGVFDEHGKLIELQSVGRDITERRQAEAKLQGYHERLRALSHELLHAQENERRKLARELHDEIGQMLTVIGLRLHQLNKGEHGRNLDEDIAYVNRCIEQVRKLSLDLRPPMLDVLGLESALRWLADTQSQRADLAIEVAGHLQLVPRQPELEIACFRIVQESLTNILRHAQARNVRIALRQTEREIELEISDDGIGFDIQEAQKRGGRGGSFGILAMQERAELMGGHLEIESAPGRGTKIKVSFPLALSETN